MPKRLANPQDPSLPLPDQMHERFVVNVFGGMAYNEAWKEATGEDMRHDFYAVIRNPISGIARRLQWLQMQLASSTILTKKAQAEYASGIMLTPIGLVDRMHPYCQKYKRETRVSRDGGEIVIETFEMPSKSAMANLLAEMTGAKSPIQKRDVSNLTPKQAAMLATLDSEARTAVGGALADLGIGGEIDAPGDDEEESLDIDSEIVEEEFPPLLSGGEDDGDEDDE